MMDLSPPPQVRALNVDGSLNLLGLETVRLIYFRNKMAGKRTTCIKLSESIPLLVLPAGHGASGPFLTSSAAYTT